MSKHPVIHLLHDAGLAVWTGGSLMGAVGLNGATAKLTDPYERASASTAGWTRWAPVNAAAVAAHLIGGAGLTVTEWQRVRTQKGVGRSTAVKAAVTGVGLGVAGWSAVLNRKMAASLPAPVKGATEPGAATPPDVASTQRQLKVVQWLNPLVGLGLLYATAVHEEQRTVSQQAKGRLQGALGLLRTPQGAGAAAAAGLALAARRRQARRPEVELVEVDVVEVGAVGVDVVDLTDGSATSTLRDSSRIGTATNI